jgi:hypothetical protein
MAKKTSKSSATSSKGTNKTKPATTESKEDAIRRRAYDLHLERGGAHGSDIDDWLRAEREIHAQNRPKSASRRKK